MALRATPEDENLRPPDRDRIRWSDRVCAIPSFFACSENHDLEFIFETNIRALKSSRPRPRHTMGLMSPSRPRGGITRHGEFRHGRSLPGRMRRPLRLRLLSNTRSSFGRTGAAGIKVVRCDFPHLRRLPGLALHIK